MKVAVGLSGGVDSAVSAALLVEQGHEVTGVFIICYNGPGCRSDEDRKDALEIALQFNIPFEVLDYRETYQQKVLEYFKSEYQAGRTPNPDVMCNKEIKFGLFYDWALEKGFDYIATGHYAQIKRNQIQQNNFDVLDCQPQWRASGCARQNYSCWLCQAKDKHKDQTYFLYQLKQEQLSHILFPIGHLLKSEVREEARKRQIKVAEKKDSTGICFVGEVPVSQFLKEMGVKEQEGEVIWQDKVVGKHKGVWFYTIGQRHGFTINDNRLSITDKKNPEPMYVIEKQVQKNQLVVGLKEECFKSEFVIEKMHWINGDYRLPITDDRKIKVRIRHGGELVLAIVDNHKSVINIQTDVPFFGVAAGQSVVFYESEVCLGGGIIL